MVRRFISAILLCGALLLSSPGAALAYAFGGQTSLVLPCFLFGFVPYGSISMLGPPNPGLYIWTPVTRTYQNGFPSHPGQWLLGLTSIPYICVIAPVGPIIVPGMVIDMMGSSN